MFLLLTLIMHLFARNKLISLYVLNRRGTKLNYIINHSYQQSSYSLIVLIIVIVLLFLLLL